jgi:WD40 repeat protein
LKLSKPVAIFYSRSSTTSNMFENVCAIPLDYDLFAQAIHPEEPIVAVGLASGHVQTYRLPAGASDDSDNDETLASESGFGHIDTLWKTRRHKGSCRTLGFSVDGSQLYSAGTDGIVKAADSATGKVTSKIAVPLDLYVSMILRERARH